VGRRLRADPRGTPPNFRPTTPKAVPRRKACNSVYTPRVVGPGQVQPNRPRRQSRGWASPCKQVHANNNNNRGVNDIGGGGVPTLPGSTYPPFVLVSEEVGLPLCVRKVAVTYTPIWSARVVGLYLSVWSPLPLHSPRGAMASRPPTLRYQSPTVQRSVTTNKVRHIKQ